MPVNPRNVFAPIATHQTLSVGNSAQTLNPPAGATQIRMQATGQNIRFTLDGSTPSSSVGFILYASDPMMTMSVPPGMMIRVVSDNALLSATFQYQWGSW